MDNGASIGSTEWLQRVFGVTARMRDDRLRKNVASDDASFRRNLPLRKGALHEEEIVRCGADCRQLKEADAGFPMPELFRRIGTTEQMIYRSTSLKKVAEAAPQRAIVDYLKRHYLRLNGVHAFGRNFNGGSTATRVAEPRKRRFSYGRKRWRCDADAISTFCSNVKAFH